MCCELLLVFELREGGGGKLAPFRSLPFFFAAILLLSHRIEYI